MRESLGFGNSRELRVVMVLIDYMFLLTLCMKSKIKTCLCVFWNESS